MIRRLAAFILLPMATIVAFQGPSITKHHAHKTTRTNMEVDPNHHELIPLEKSRRNVIQDAINGSFLAVALVSGAPSPVLAADIAKQVKAIENEFRDSINSNGAPEKHLPKVTLSTVNGNADITMVQVTVPHVMDPEKPHWIQAIWLKEESSGDVAVAKVLPATEPSPPGLRCGVPKGARLTPYLYCNLHGLWKGDTFIA